jgi:hypothetical protein
MYVHPDEMDPVDIMAALKPVPPASRREHLGKLRHFHREASMSTEFSDGDERSALYMEAEFILRFIAEHLVVEPIDQGLLRVSIVISSDMLDRLYAWAALAGL